MASEAAILQALEEERGGFGFGFDFILLNPDDEAFILFQQRFQTRPAKPEVLPASKGSIEALPRVLVAEEGIHCAICLESFHVGDGAGEMPCDHRFHSCCIEKWLGIHGSCPLCRFLMPSVENENGDGEGPLMSIISITGDGNPTDVDLDPGRGSGNSDSEYGNSTADY